MPRGHLRVLTPTTDGVRVGLLPRGESEDTEVSSFRWWARMKTLQESGQRAGSEPTSVQGLLVREQRAAPEGGAVGRARRSRYTDCKGCWWGGRAAAPGFCSRDTRVLLFLPASRHCISQSDVFGWELCDYMGECGALRGSIPLRTWPRVIRPDVTLHCLCPKQGRCNVMRCRHLGPWWHDAEPFPHFGLCSKKIQRI